MGNSSTTGGNVAFQNLKVLVNGTQFGTTQGTLSNGGKYTFSGTPFMVPSGNTVNVNVYADTLSSATGTATNATNLSGLSGTGAISFTSISLASSVPGQSVTFAGQAKMSVAADSSEPAATTLTMGSTGNTLAVYRFQETSNIEPVKITDLTVTDVSTSTATTSLPAFSNLQLFSGSTLLGTAGSAVASSTQSCTITTAFVAASSTMTVSLPGSVATGTYQGQVTDANGTTIYFPISLNGADTAANQAGQIATTTAAMLQSSSTAQTTLGIASSSIVTINPSTGKVVLISTGSASLSPASISIFTLGTVTTAVNNAGTAQVQSCTSGTVNSGTYTYAFHFATPIVVPQANTTLVTLKGDVATYSGGGATDNSSHVFSIATSTAVTALGNTSNRATSVSGSGSGNAMTVLRSTMTVNTSPSSFTQAGKQPLQQIGSITLTANNAGPVMLKSLNLEYTGSNVTSTGMAALLATVVLKGPNSVDVTASTTGSGFGAQLVVGNTGTASSTTWTFPTSSVNAASSTLVISPGSPVTLQLWGTTNSIVNGANVSQSLAVTMQNTSDVVYLDATDGTGSSLNLPVSSLPLTVSSFSWAQGQ